MISSLLSFTLPQYLVFLLHRLVQTLTPSIHLYLAQIRGTLKSWTKLWCVLKPGVLLIYKTHKNGQWVGTVLLNACELIERPSKKDGFCFKLFHPLEQSIWAVKVRTRNSPPDYCGVGMHGAIKKIKMCPFIFFNLHTFFHLCLFTHSSIVNRYSSLTTYYM